MLQTYTLKTQLFADLSSLKELNFIKFNSEIVEIDEKFVLSFGNFYNKIKNNDQ